MLVCRSTERTRRQTMYDSSAAIAACGAPLDERPVSRAKQTFAQCTDSLRQRGSLSAGVVPSDKPYAE